MKNRKQFKCKFCNWVFLSKIINGPKVCPKCHNNWRKKRIVKQIKKEVNDKNGKK